MDQAGYDPGLAATFPHVSLTSSWDDLAPLSVLARAGRDCSLSSTNIFSSPGLYAIKRPQSKRGPSQYPSPPWAKLLWKVLEPGSRACFAIDKQCDPGEVTSPL